MKRISTLLMAGIIALLIVGCCSKPEEQKADVQVYTLANTDSKVTAQSISAAFNSTGLNVLSSNNMNKAFKARFGEVHYDTYHLGIFINKEITFKILKKYPQFGVLTPLTMSVWQDKDGSINISTLSLRGMARVTGIPIDDVDLVAYADLVQKSLKKALPEGEYKNLPYGLVTPPTTLATSFVLDIDMDGSDPEDYIEEFEDVFESELASVGFIFPNYLNLQEEIFDEAGYTDVYDFYHTYSFCKLNVIYTVSKIHPEAGAWAPCSLYLYKKKGEDKLHAGFLSVNNWINTIDIKDKPSIEVLEKAQQLLQDIITETAE